MQRIRFCSLAGWAGALAVLFTVACGTLACAQQFGEGKWADDNDAVAKQLIEQERKWAVLSCSPSNVIEEFVADDFVGTSPDGPTYTKSGLVDRHSKPTPEHDCKLLSAKVRFFGPDVAIIYGKETAVRTGPDGKDSRRTLIWTDTALRRKGKWQLIAVQDMVDPKK
jgi:hypothetical protein